MYSSSRERRADVLSVWVLGIAFVLSVAWIVTDVVPRFVGVPLSAPLQDTMDSPYRRLAASAIVPGGPIEIGVAIRPAVPGDVVAVRFYKVAGDRGPHVAHVWNERGDLIATAAFDRESANGWQEAALPRPVRVAADQPIVASYFSPAGSRLAESSSVFVNRPPSRAITDAFHFPESAPSSGPTNFYRLGSSGFPTTATVIHQFWVDVAFARTGRSR
jgi:hypothetical protein